MPDKKKKKYGGQKGAYQTFAETIAKLRKKVDKYKNKNEPIKAKPIKRKKVKKPAATTKKKKLVKTLATKDVQRQLRRGISKEDVERMTDKRRKSNPNKKRGGY